MWSKFKNLLGGKKEQSPTEIIDGALLQLTQAIASQRRGCEEAIKHEQDLTRDLDKVSKEADALYKQATRAAMAGDDANAQRLLSQEQNKREQQLSYSKMLDQTTQTVQRLEKHTHLLEMKLQDMRSKRVLLITQIESAKTQQDINAYLNQVGDGLFNGLEETLEQTEIALAISSGIDTDDLDIEKALKQSGPIKNTAPSASIEQLRRDADEAERKRKEAEEAKRMSVVDKLFETTKHLEVKAVQNAKKKEAAQKEDLMSEFMRVEPDKQGTKKPEDVMNQFIKDNAAGVKTAQGIKNPEDVMNQFINDNAEGVKTAQGTKKPEDIVSQFMNEEPAKAKPADNPLDSFFNPPPPPKPDEKQQLLDDFFKD